MNHLYRLVKSKKDGRYVVAPETAKPHVRTGKTAKVVVAAAISLTAITMRTN